MPKKVILDLDDFSITSPNFNYILQLKEHFPDFKVTLFTIPLDPALLSAKTNLKKYQEWSEMLYKYQDWIEIAIHGFMHAKQEIMVDYKQAKKILKASERMLTRVSFKEKRFFIGSKWKKYKLDIPYVKIFKAPKWEMTDDAYKACRDKGYIVAVDRNQATPNIKGLTTYKYNWSIEEPFPDDYKVIKGHGHIAGMKNDISLCFTNLLKMPTDTKFLTISEYMNYEST